MLKKSFKPGKCKTVLNLAKARTKLMKNKKDVQIKQLRRDVAQLLQSGQDQTARIRVEHVVREEKMLAAYEMIEMYCELLVGRLPIIETQKNCPLDLKEAIASLIFAAPRCGDIQELKDIRKHFTVKYGKEFATAAVELRPACGVSSILVQNLSVQAPDGQTKVKILKGIAEEHNFQWEPNWFKDEDLMPSVDIPKKLHADNNSNKQMEPPNVQIADDLKENNYHTTEKLENSFQRHPRANISEIPIMPPSPPSRPDVRPSAFSANVSRTTENKFSTNRQQRNREFKNATEAAQVAAESAELASMAARAAAELSIRDSNRRVLSSGRSDSDANRQYARSVSQQKHEQGQVNSSFTQRSPRHQVTTNQQSDISEGRDRESPNNEYSQSERQYDTRQQEFRASETISDNEYSHPEMRYDTRQQEFRESQSRAHVSTPSSSKGHYLRPMSPEPNIEEYDTEPDENPFHGETVESENQPRNFDSQASGFRDENDAFSDLEYLSDEIDSYSNFGASGQRSHWEEKSSYLLKSESIKGKTISSDYDERNVFKGSDGSIGFDSGTSVFVSSDQRPKKLDINEQVDNHVANAVFDDSGSSDDDEFFSDPVDKHKSSSGTLSPRDHVLLPDDNPYFDHGLSHSFRTSSIYSKLMEPLPDTFDDDDGGASSESEKELQTENIEPKSGSYRYREPDWDSHVTIGFIRSSFAEKGADDSFMSDEHMQENQNLYVGSVDKDKVLESPRSFRLPLESKDRSEFEKEAYSSSEGGIKLNLGSLPGGRRNRPSWLSQHARDGFSGISSPSSKAAINDDTVESEDSSPAHKFQGSPSHQDREHIEITERSYNKNVNENVYKTGTNESTGYLRFDDHAPISPMSKNLLGAGVSRRTKGSTSRSGNSQQSSHTIDPIKTGRFSSTSNASENSPSRATETTNSSSRIIGQSSQDDDAPYELRSDINLTTPTSAEIPRESITSENRLSRENSGNRPSHVHPKLPDFDEFKAHLHSLRKNRK